MRVWSICGVYSRAGFILVIAFLAAAFIQGRCLIEEIRYIILYSDANYHNYMPSFNNNYNNIKIQ